MQASGRERIVGSDLVEFASGEAMMVFDASFRVLDWNEAAESLTGIPACEAVGRFCWEVLGADDETGAVACHAGCSYGRLACEGWPVPTRRLWVRTASGGKKPVSLTTVAVRTGDSPLFLHLLRNGDEERPVTHSAPRPELTPRQHEILGYLADGVPAKVIARELRLSEVTVRNHIRPILTRLGCHSQLAAVAEARRLGLLDS